MPRALTCSKAMAAATDELGEGEAAAGGVFDHGTQEEDDPVTWEAHVSPRWSPRLRRPGDPSRTLSALAGAGAGVKKKHPREVGSVQGATGAAAEGNGGVGGPNRSVDVGERSSARTRPSKGGPCWCDLQEGTMTDASTSEDMSPGLRKVAERARKEPEGVFHSLAHIIDVPALERAYRRARKDAAVGVHGVTKGQFGQDLETRLADLHERLQTKRYRHQPIQRVHIPKEKGKTRPIGVSAFKDIFGSQLLITRPPYHLPAGRNQDRCPSARTGGRASAGPRRGAVPPCASCRTSPRVPPLSPRR